MKKIFLVGPATGGRGYDEYDSFVVLAEDVAEARKIAEEFAKDPTGPGDLANSAEFRTCPCKEIDLNGISEVILDSYNRA